MDISASLARTLADKAPPPDLPPAAAARAARLRYVADSAPGITRRRLGTAFAYRAGAPSATRPNTSPCWCSAGRCRASGARVAQDLGRAGLPREKVLAAVVRLMECTLARVGNPEYARDNNSFGLTTLQNRHMHIVGGRVELDFRGKSGVRHRSVVADRTLARILRRCRDLPGSELFQYLDEDGERRSIDSGDVNDYLREISGAEITAKDFRTWAATSLALVALAGRVDEEPTKKAVVEMVQEVAGQLGNTPAVCRKCYIHPAVIESFATGKLAPFVALLSGGAAVKTARVERALIRFLKEKGLPAGA